MARSTPGVESLAAVSDPRERAQRALAEMEDARALMEKLAETRARAVYELYQEHGAPKAARLLGINRVNLYRIIRQLPEVRDKHTAVALQTTLAVMTVLTSAGTD